MSEEFPDSVKGVMVFERVPEYYRVGDEVEHCLPPWSSPRGHSRARLSNNKKRCVSAKAKARKKRR